ncbi:Zinc finger MYM-type protein 1-like [Oopsacas minuta]|uniref:Zinc finger MYM-type protein 1-like n=1 Tax=Oopsacas minuta TaxID=111878 RepID=A0AAV7KEH0_9METZ|nr:Zinc finger MYM-type protein 1-like [Oopsacas minuta]
MFNHLFSMTNGLSKTLQDPDLDFSAAMSLIDATIETLQTYRSEKQWKEIWNEALTVADDHDIEISSLPRKRKHKLPGKLCDALLTTTVVHREELSTENQYCISIYYRVLDCIIDELNKRFNNESKLCMKGISACSPKSKNFFEFATIKPMLVNYKISEEDV